MNEAEERFAARLAEDLERVLGAGIAIDDVELTAGAAGTDAQVRATLLIEGRMETIDVHGPDLLALYRPLVERAAELRLAGAFWRMIGPA